MKMLTACALLCAMMALATAQSTIQSITVMSNFLAPPEEKTDLDKRTCCPCGWTRIYGRCFRYVPYCRRWADAEKYCHHLGGNLASIHSVWEYRAIQRLIMRTTRSWYTHVWIGGHDAAQERTWLWSDGTRFKYRQWCCGEPNNYLGKQHCLQMNYTACRCWDDDYCWRRKPFVCVRRR
ncbi:ladderlectin-like [Scomber japonicus]|uniref:ladderlectin-like n=1 Tax=Scomber japonicus TaxID=13676 RepID=UPI00230544E6|nr:ladderlectin-like [Scomber japonicus]